MHEIVVQSFENEKILLNKARELRQDLSKQQQKLETVSQQQGETALSLERLTKTLEEVTAKQTQGELDSTEQRVQIIEWDVNQIEQDRNEALQQLRQQEDDKVSPDVAAGSR